jgi:hypothetical protein
MTDPRSSSRRGNRSSIRTSSQFERSGLAGSRSRPPAFDLFPRHPYYKGGTTLLHEQAVAILATAVNDAARTRIGDPSRNHWAVSIFESDAKQATEVAKSLDTLGIYVPGELQPR